MFEAADLTSQPAKEVVVVLCRQIRENILDPPSKLENQERDVHLNKKKMSFMCWKIHFSGSYARVCMVNTSRQQSISAQAW